SDAGGGETFSLTTTDNFTLSGAFTIGADAADAVTLDISNDIMSVAGNVDFQNLDTLTVTNSTMTLGNNASDGTQTISFANKTLGDLIINAPGDTKQLTGGFTSGLFDAQNGTIDFNGQTIETTGNFTMGTDSQVIADADAMNGTTITVGGDLALTGEVGDLLALNATADWIFIINGALATADNVSVSFSDASGGLLIDASMGSFDGGSNLNWNFGGSAPVVPELPEILIPEVIALLGDASSPSYEDTLEDVQTSFAALFETESEVTVSYDAGSKTMIISRGTESRSEKDYFIIDYKDGKKWKKRYIHAKYRTVIIIYEGKVVEAPYDENGPDDEKETVLTPELQNSTTREGVVD
ncbi:hypothetical protein IID04_05540, partial [PVC group bacterium]|nr:hypothetical protein [PVC group bacterium]